MYFYELIFVTLLFYAFEAKRSQIHEGKATVSSDLEDIAFYITFNNTSSDDYNVRVILGDNYVTGGTEGNVTEEFCKSVVPAGQTKTIKLNSKVRHNAAVEDQWLIYVQLEPFEQKNKRKIVKIIFNIYLHKGNSRIEIITINCDRIHKGPRIAQFSECNGYHTIQGGTYFTNKTKTCDNVLKSIHEKYKNTVVGLGNSLTAHVVVRRDTQEKEENFLPLFTGNEKEKDSSEIVILNTTEHNEPFGHTFTEEVRSVSTKQHSTMKHEKIVHRKKLTLDSSIYKYFKQYMWIAAMLAAILMIQSILMLAICMRRKCKCLGEKRVVSHFFRPYHQESVTTPLISSSVLDTEYPKNPFKSESSTDIANLKCYKACEKDKSVNTKISMSDDVLSKFVNRRDWKSHKNDDDNNKNENQYNQIVKVHSKHKNVDENISKHSYDFQKNNSAVVSKEIVDSENTNKIENINYSSDREGNYHSFSCYNTQINSDSTFEKKNNENNGSKLRENAAQTYFSKDSIDAILSDRKIYLADENLSKYTFSSISGKNKSTELLNKTSKNIVKYFYTLLHKRSRQSSQSEPGKDKDLKLLHMSEASLYSSNDSE